MYYYKDKDNIKKNTKKEKFTIFKIKIINE